MRYIIIVFLFVSCGTSIQRGSNKELLSYVQRFEEVTGVKGQITINFSTLPDQILGVCYKYDDGKRDVEIDLSYWKEIDDLTKEEIVFHELGHCVLNRDHDETLIETSKYSQRIPNSIMYPYAFGYTMFYEEFREHYINELTDPGKPL